MKLTTFSLLLLASLTACSGDGPDFKSQHPRIFIDANRDRLARDLANKTPAAMRFAAMVDRAVGGDDIYGFSAWNAALMGQLTGDSKYCKAAVAQIDKQVKEADDAVLKGQQPPVADDDYLQIGDMIGDLALTYDWCFDLAKEHREAWLTYANQAVSNVWNYQSAKWGSKKIPWDGWAIDDPSDNYYYSFLRATMLLGLAAHDDFDGADKWLEQFRTTKLANELVPTFDAELVGGGSREGTGYGVSQRELFELYELWQSSTDEKIATLTGHTRASMLATIHAIVPTLDRIAPTGDHSRDSTAALFDYHRDYLQELISLFPDDPVSGRAQALLASSSVPEMGEQFMFAYDFLHPGVQPTQLDGLNTVYHAKGIGQLYARSGWDKHATWINFTAGAYTQSHAHEDQGALLVYKDGWLAYDPNIDSHSGLHQEPDAHNLVRVAGERQYTGSESKLVALHRGDGFLHAAGDLTDAYAKSESGTKVQKMQREIVYLEPDVIVVYDRVTTAAGAQQIWQLSSPVSPSISGANATFNASGHALSVQRLAPAGASSSVHTFTDDFSGGFRLDETTSGGDQRYLHVLSIDGAATNVQGSGDGVTLTVGGRQVAVTFSHDAVGGSITIDGNSTTLAAGLDTLPE